MRKSVRFLSNYYLGLLAAMAAFWAVVLLGLWMTKSMDHLFGAYYRMFPTMVAIFVSAGAVMQGNYLNIALGMNASRPGLYGAVQLMIVGLTLAGVLLTAALWLLGGQMGIEGDCYMPYLGTVLPMGTCCLAMGECGILVGYAGSGVMRTVWMVAYSIFAMAVAIGMMFVVLLADNAALNVGMTAGGMAVAAVLSVIESQWMKKAVVKA